MEHEQPQALGGVRVLDLAGPIGAYCGRLLAGLGADVIKVEPPEGDPMRRWPPFYHDRPHPERSLAFFHYHLNKRGITLDLEKPQGRDLFLSLAARADLVLEGFEPGYLPALGLGFERLQQANPGLTLVSITPFGQNGPYAHYKASDLVGLAMGGVLWLAGWPDRAPMAMGASQGYFTASLLAANAAMLALHYRDLAGEGQHVDVSMEEAVALDLETSMQFYDTRGLLIRRGGHYYTPLNPDLGPGMRRVYTAADGYINMLVGVQRLEEWTTLLSWIDSEGMAGDLTEPRYREVETVRKDIAHVQQVFEAFTSRHTRQELFEGAHFRFPVEFFMAPVNTAADIAADPHLAARGFFIQVDHPELGTSLRYPGPPFRLSETPWQVRKCAPLLGEDNCQVYGTELGLSEDELQRLQAAGAI
ncbi:MAG: CoA transferase [Chloroflexi bacterium]|nr:CoA transferase [Chloroflexota bacterium]